MLDHMSRGRLEVGVGRGVSPYELGFHKVDHGKSREIFFDAYDCLKAALAGDEFSYDGEYFKYSEVPMSLRPLQQPHPPFWYGSSNTIGATWAGEQGLHFTSNGPTDAAKDNIDAYRAALKKRKGGAAHPKAEFKGGSAIGMLRHIVVADTDEEAKRIAKPALEAHAGSLNWLRNRHGDTEYTKRLNIHRSVDFEGWEKMEMIIAGNPDTVTKEVKRQVKVLGLNYLISYLFFGTMSLADAMRSLTLFNSEVMPRLAKL